MVRVEVAVEGRHTSMVWATGPAGPAAEADPRPLAAGHQTGSTTLYTALGCHTIQKEVQGHRG